ncbi:hypothetical protein IQ216_00110 [Cyanobium sp. LEGE 06143]|nr:hypothetical protein [Cyanobium sp. LEGE 06143]MBE9171549.1 hypothetical protein [Cyanobium sp. LEGE 06143]
MILPIRFLACCELAAFLWSDFNDDFSSISRFVRNRLSSLLLGGSAFHSF